MSTMCLYHHSTRCLFILSFNIPHITLCTIFSNLYICTTTAGLTFIPLPRLFIRITHHQSYHFDHYHCSVRCIPDERTIHQCHWSLPSKMPSQKRMKLDGASQQFFHHSLVHRREEEHSMTLRIYTDFDWSPRALFLLPLFCNWRHWRRPNEMKASKLSCSCPCMQDGRPMEEAEPWSPRWTYLPGLWLGPLGLSVPPRPGEHGAALNENHFPCYCRGRGWCPHHFVARLPCCVYSWAASWARGSLALAPPSVSSISWFGARGSLRVTLRMPIPFSFRWAAPRASDRDSFHSSLPSFCGFLVFYVLQRHRNATGWKVRSIEGESVVTSLALA